MTIALFSRAKRTLLKEKSAFPKETLGNLIRFLRLYTFYPENDMLYVIMLYKTIAQFLKQKGQLISLKMCISQRNHNILHSLNSVPTLSLLNNLLKLT